MDSKDNPYLCPDLGRESGGNLEGPDNWSNGKLVALFFSPSLIFIGFVVASIASNRLGFYFPPRLFIPAMGACVFLRMIGVSIRSAHIHMRRQGEGVGTPVLMAFVYLIAEVFALFLTVAALAMIRVPFMPFGPDF